MKQPQIVELVSAVTGYSPFSVKWIPKTAKVICVGENARGNGVTTIYKLEKDAMQKCGYKCMSVLENGSDAVFVCTGDFRGGLACHDIATWDPTWVIPSAHTRIINAIDACGGTSGPVEIVSGSQDGCVKVWDPRTPEPLATISPSNEKADCWSVCFGNAVNQSDRVVVSGYDNGDIKMLDLRTMTVRWEYNMKKGVCHLSFDRKDIAMNKLSAACLEGHCCIFDMRTYNNSTGYAHIEKEIGKSTLWGCHYLPQDREIMAITGGNGVLGLYKYEYPMKRYTEDENKVRTGVPGTLNLLNSVDHLTSQPVLAFDWHIEKRGLCAMASLDQKISVIACTKLE